MVTAPGRSVAGSSCGSPVVTSLILPLPGFVVAGHRARRRRLDLGAVPDPAEGHRMSDTPRNDSTEDRGDDIFRDPTAPSEAPSYGSPSSAGATEHTEQLPTGGDTQQVPTESSVPPPPAAPQSPYSAPPAADAPQNPYASPDPAAQNPYAAPPAAPSYPTQGEVASQHGAPG